MIRVYDSTERLFATNGIKTLTPFLAEIYKEDNGDYYVELRDVIDNFEYYQKGMIVRVPTPWGIQGFRCDNPCIKNNRVECKAWHISYDSKYYVVQDAYSVDKNCNDALDHFNSSTDRPSPFTTISDITAIASARMIRKSLYEVYGELVNDYYGGHWYRDNFTLGIKSRIGEDRGVVLAQNKNITDMQIEENWDDICTKILPYTTDGEREISLDDTYVEIDEDLYDEVYTKVVKFENELDKDNFETEEEFVTETKKWLREQANTFLQENKVPKVNYSVSANIDNVSDVGDTIYIKHPKCKVDLTTNVIKVVYDAIRKKYVKIEFGNFKKSIRNLSQKITADANAYADEKITESKTLLQGELEEATAQIKSVMGNSYVINETGNEIIVVDRLPKEEAIYCIKINSAGIGFSSTGIYGTFNSAWTIDGTLNMQNINVINLTASLIKGGILKLGGINNSSGTFELYDNANNLIALMDKTGLTVYATTGDYVKLNPEVGFAGYDKNDNKVYWADGNIFHMANAEIENIAKFAGMIQMVPVSTSSNKGIGFVAISN